MKETKIPTSFCPSCNYEMDTAVQISSAYVKKLCPGMISLCGKCGTILIFKDDLTQRRITEDELLKIRLDPEAWAKITTAQQLIKARKSHP